MKDTWDRQVEIVKQNEKIMILLMILICLIVGFCMYLRLNEESFILKKDKLYFENISSKREVGKLNKYEKIENNLFMSVKYPEIGYEEIDSRINDIINGDINEVIEQYKTDEKVINKYLFINYEIYVGKGNIVNLIVFERLEDNEFNVLKSDKKIYYFSLDNNQEYSKNDIFNDNYIDKEKEWEITKDDFLLKGDKILYLTDNKEFNLDDIKEYLKIDISKGEIYPNDIEEKVLTIVDKKMLVIQDVVMYNKDAINADIVKTLKKDEEVKVYGVISNGYCLLLYDEGIGYVEAKYLIDKPVEIPVTSESVSDTERQDMYVLDNVNVRASADNKSSIVGKVSYGEKVVKTGESKNWYRIEFGSKEGFIKKSFLSYKEVIKYTIKIDVPAQGDIDPSKPMLALTFDDGPNGTSTVKILDTLEKYNAKATFFDLGNLVEKYPDVVRREAKLGEVGTHTYSHKNLNTLGEVELLNEINYAREALKNVLGEYPKLLRPPYGSANAFVKQHITDMAIINWNVDTLDWKYRNKDLILSEINKYGNLDGKIILMHSIHAATAETIESLVPTLIDYGYQLVTVSELAYYRNATLETGIIYYGFAK